MRSEVNAKKSIPRIPAIANRVGSEGFWGHVHCVIVIEAGRSVSISSSECRSDPLPFCRVIPPRHMRFSRTSATALINTETSHSRQVSAYRSLDVVKQLCRHSETVLKILPRFKQESIGHCEPRATRRSHCDLPRALDQ